eukprot:5739081-Pyramimonas_sp.AAC.1
MRAKAPQDCPEGEIALLDELRTLLHQVRYDQTYPASDGISDVLAKSRTFSEAHSNATWTAAQISVRE